MSIRSDMETLLEARTISIPKGRIKELARDITKELHRVVPDSPKPLGKSGALVTKQFAFTNAAGEHVQPYVVVRARPSRGSKFYVLGAGIGKSSKVTDDVVVIDLNGTMPAADLKRGSNLKGGLVQDQLYKVLIHELTHAAEPRRRQSKRGYHAGGSEVPTTGEVDTDAYYNDPKEVRAYAQEIVDELADTLKSRWDTFKKMFGPGKGLDYVLKTSTTWQEIKPHLTPKNRKYVIKTVATALRDLG